MTSTNPLRLYAIGYTPYYELLVVLTAALYELLTSLLFLNLILIAYYRTRF